MTSRVLLALVLYFLPMLGEAIRSRRHERLLRRDGAVEPGDDLYRAMAVAYPASFLAMAVEGVWRAQPVDTSFFAGLCLWTLSKFIKYWAMAALGPRWSFRVLVQPGRPLVTWGPYRWLRHPNYVGVVGELLAGCLLFPAFVAGPMVTLGFTGLLLRRLRVEDRALAP